MFLLLHHLADHDMLPLLVRSTSRMRTQRRSSMMLWIALPGKRLSIKLSKSKHLLILWKMDKTEQRSRETQVIKAQAIIFPRGNPLHYFLGVPKLARTTLITFLLLMLPSCCGYRQVLCYCRSPQRLYSNKRYQCCCH